MYEHFAFCRNIILCAVFIRRANLMSRSEVIPQVTSLGSLFWDLNRNAPILLQSSKNTIVDHFINSGSFHRPWLGRQRNGRICSGIAALFGVAHDWATERLGDSLLSADGSTNVLNGQCSVNLSQTIDVNRLDIGRIRYILNFSIDGTRHVNDSVWALVNFLKFTG